MEAELHRRLPGTGAIALLLLAGLASPVWAEEPEQVEDTTLRIDAATLGSEPKIAVMDLRASGVAPALAQNLTEVVTAELKSLRGFQVISHQEIKAMLSFEELRRGLGCEEESCLAEIGGALGVDLLVAGNVGRIEQTYLLSLKVIDIRHARTAGREQESFVGPPDGLLGAARFAIRRVFGLPYDGQGRLSISVSEDAAEVALDGEALGQAPSLRLPERLSAGKYRVAVVKQGFFPLEQDVYVEPARPTRVQLNLRERPAKWYQTWWFWTVVGVVAAGGVTTAVVLGTLPDDRPSAGRGVAIIPGS